MTSSKNPTTRYMLELLSNFSSNKDIYTKKTDAMLLTEATENTESKIFYKKQG